MEFNKARWSCPWNGDHNCTQNSAGVVGVKEYGGVWVEGQEVVGVQRVVGYRDGWVESRVGVKGIVGVKGYGGGQVGGQRGGWGMGVNGWDLGVMESSGGGGQVVVGV